jgi:hypothetical protein
MSNQNIEIEDISLLSGFENNLVEIYFNLSGIETSQHIENLSIEITNKHIILDSLTEETPNIHISKDNITGIEYEITDKVVIYLLHGKIIINKL